MKTTVSYNIKKVLAGTILVALPFAFGGCEKDPVKPNENGGNGGNTQPQKHWVILKCDKQMTNLAPQIIADSANKPDVCGFKIQLSNPYQYEGFGNTNLNKFVKTFDTRATYAKGLPFEGENEFYVGQDIHDTTIAKIRSRGFEVMR